MAKGLTKAKARTLIKREFGINPKGLKTPEYIDENPEFPFYELVTGNHVINVYPGSGSNDEEIIILHIRNPLGTRGLSECFYSDNLEPAIAVEESLHWKDIIEQVTGVDLYQRDKRLTQEACSAMQNHKKRKKNSR